MVLSKMFSLYTGLVLVLFFLQVQVHSQFQNIIVYFNRTTTTGYDTKKCAALATVASEFCEVLARYFYYWSWFWVDVGEESNSNS